MKQFRIVLMSTFVLVASLIGQRSAAQSLKTFPDPSILAVNNVQYIGLMDQLIVFELRLTDLSDRSVTLSILDENDNEIWSEKIDGSLIKRYKFDKNRFHKIRFHVKGRRQILNETFNVSYKTEEKLFVLRVK